LAVIGKTRYDGLPDVPTVGEFLPGYEVDSFAGIGVRKGTPREIIEKLNHEINAGLASPAIGARLAELAAIPLVVSPIEFDALMAAATEKWAKVIRTANIKPE
jgi:tripartite-type tricarboxylate transporter receptor subunit TctC